MDAGGVRGLRFTVGNPETAVVSIDMIEPLAKRVADLGWHVQIHMRAEQIVEHAALLESLPTPVVFDHLGRLPQPAHDNGEQRVRDGCALAAQVVETRARNREHFDVYMCPRCGRFELFVDGVGEEFRGR